MEQIEGQVAVVTGGAGGIGRALVEEFLAEGAKIVVSDIQLDPLERTVKELSDRGEVLDVLTDVTDPTSVQSLADRTYETFGSCHIQDLNQLARVVVEGIKSEKFIHMIGIDSIGPPLRSRADFFEKGELVPHHPGLLG